MTPQGPVPDDHDWMRDRFDAGVDWGLPVDIEHYVADVAKIGQLKRGNRRDLKTPIGDGLPANLSPRDAAYLADLLAPALARAHELLRLLDRRAAESES